MRYNCWVNVSAEDSELVELLTQAAAGGQPEGTGRGGRCRCGRKRRVSISTTDGAAAAAGAAADVLGLGHAAPAGGRQREPSTALPRRQAAGAVEASEARALIELVTARGIAQGQLGTLLGLEKSTVSRLAAGLERKGWIGRGRDEANQRYVRLYLTPEGSRVAAGCGRPGSPGRPGSSARSPTRNGRVCRPACAG